MSTDPVPPFRRNFDAARDPYTARNALGITSTGGGGGGGAPIGAQYITAAADPTLTAERVLTNTASITWDFSTPGQAKANSAAGGGNVSNSGTPTLGQYAKWVTATTIQGVAPATVLADIGAQPAGSYLTTAAAAATYQPLDADLTAIAALAGTNVIYYRSAANVWSPVTVSTGLSFSGGTLACTVTAGGNVSNVGTPTNGQLAQWTTATTIQGVSLATAGIQPLDATLTALAAYNTNGLLTQTAADTFTGRSIAVPAAGIGITNANGVSGNPTLALANDLAALEALAGTNTIYYRSGTDTWSPVVVSTGLAFSGGNLTATAGGGNVSTSGTITTGLYAKWVTATTIQSVAHATVLSDIGAAPIVSPTFTGDPKAPTPATADNDTSIATTAFVKAQFPITGVTNGSNAAAGDVGEYIEATATVGYSSGFLAAASISLSPGDWDVWAAANYQGGVSGARAFMSVSTSSGAFGPLGNTAMTMVNASLDAYPCTSPVRMSITASTTVYGIALSDGAVTSISAKIAARRVR